VGASRSTGRVVGLILDLLLLSAGVSKLVLGIIAGVAWLWTLVLTGFWRTIISAGLAWVSSLSVLLLFALAFRALAFQPFNIPASSMMPTLQIGDYLFVSEFPYGYSRYSFFNLIPISGRIFPVEPKRGDVVVFKLPRDNSTDYIKRVIGLPGDHRARRRAVHQWQGSAAPAHRRFRDARRWRPSTAHSGLRGNAAQWGVKYTVLQRAPR